MITRPDEYKHQNDSYAIVDNNNVRGGIFDVVDLTTNNINAIPTDKRKVRSAIVNGTDSKLYIYTGATLDNPAWGTVGNWIAASGSEYVHPSGFASQPVSALTGANVISQITVNGNGHVTGVTSRQLAAGDIGAAPSTHTHSNATTSVAGFMSSTDKTKLDGITAGAEPNQNAFSKVIVGETTLNATGETDTLTLAAGSNITLTPDALTKSVTIAATGGGSGSYGFGTIAVSGQTNVVADSTNDTLTLVAGTGIAVTTNATTDTVTISKAYTATTSYLYSATGSSTWSDIATYLKTIPEDLNGNTVRIKLYSGNSYITDTVDSTTGYGLRRFKNGNIIFETTTIGVSANLYVNPYYQIAFFGSNNNITFKDIVFYRDNSTNQDYYVFNISSGNSVLFANCSFNDNGYSVPAGVAAFTYMYAGDSKVTLSKCTVNANATGSTLQVNALITCISDSTLDLTLIDTTAATKFTHVAILTRLYSSITVKVKNSSIYDIAVAKATLPIIEQTSTYGVITMV